MILFIEESTPSTVEHQLASHLALVRICRELNYKPSLLFDSGTGTLRQIYTDPLLTFTAIYINEFKEISALPQDDIISYIIESSVELAIFQILLNNNLCLDEIIQFGCDEDSYVYKSEFQSQIDSCYDHFREVFEKYFQISN